MGRYTSSAIASFVRRGIDVTRFVSHLQKEFFDFERSLVDTAYPDNYIDYNGWTYFYDCADTYTDHNGNTLYCGVLEKDNMTVYTVNEHMYSNGGGESHCLFAKNELDLLRLCEDVELNSIKIRSNDVVQQTL